MSFNSAYVLPVIVGKLVAGVCAVAIAWFMFDKTSRRASPPRSNSPCEAALHAPPRFSLFGAGRPALQSLKKIPISKMDIGIFEA